VALSGWEGGSSDRARLQRIANRRLKRPFSRAIARVVTFALLAGSLFLIPTDNAAAAGPDIPKLAQDGFIFEADDGANANANSVLAPGGTAASGGHPGNAVTARFQLKNSGDALGGSTKLAMFYDRGDGYWTKVQQGAAAVTTAGSCLDTAFDCNVISTGVGTDAVTSLAIGPDGRPWVAYAESATGKLIVANYVGVGGTGCTGGSTTWTCTEVYTATFIYAATLAFSAAGTPWIAYYDGTTLDLRMARYVGTAGTGCASSAWTCSGVEVDGATTDRGMWASIAFDSSDNPWISYFDNTAAALDARYARYVGAGGTGCAGNPAAWTCGTIDTAFTSGEYSSIAFSPNGTAYVSYYQSSYQALRLAHYVGAGGTGCTGTTAWTCIFVDDPSGTSIQAGRSSALGFAPDGNPWIAYRDGTNNYLRVANYVGGTSGTGCGDGSTAWTCTVVDTAVSGGQHNAIAFGPDGKPWVTTRDSTNSTLRLARYVGSGGTGCGGGGSSAWVCSNLDSNSHAARYTSLAFDHSGKAWITFNDSTNSTLRVLSLKRGGELLVGTSNVAADGASLTSSHADMTTTGDAANKADADCATATTWNNGKWFEVEDGSNVSLPDGSVTTQCTEVAFVLNTAQAVAGTQYRLLVASDDGWRGDRAKWRGPTSIATYPVLTLTGNEVTVSVVIDPSLTFTVSGRSAACNGASVSVGASASSVSVDLGRASAAANVIGAQDLHVVTNAANGYTVYGRKTGALVDSSGHTIGDLAGATNLSPNVFSSAGTPGFGYTVNDAALSAVGDGSTRFTNPSPKWAPMTSSDAEIAHSATGYVDKTSCIAYQVGVSTSTPAGSYSSTILYNAVPAY
jgi:hypothetical protein